MTFSRPGFGSASIQPGSTLSSDPTIRLPGNTDVRPNAPLRLDGNAPAVARNNELARGEEIQNFLNFFTDDKKGLIKFGQDEIVRAAKREVSAAVEQYGPDFLSSTNATEEMRDAYASMSPRAKEEVIAQQGFSAATRYPGLLQVEMARPEIQGALTRPGNDPETVEARSVAQSQAQQKALEAAGFPNGYQQLQYSEDIGRVNGAITSEYYKKRMDRAANAQQQQLGLSGRDAVDKAFDNEEDLRGTDPTRDALSDEPILKAFDEIVPGLEKFSPQVGARVLAEAVIGGIMEGANETQQYARLAAFQKFFDNDTQIKFPGTEESLVDIPIPGEFGNKTLRQWLEGKEGELKQAVDKDLLARTKLKIRDIYRQNPSADAYRMAQDLVRGVEFQDPENAQLADAFINQIDGTVDSSMAKNDRAMKIRIYEEGLTPQLADEIESGRYSPGFKDEIAQNRNNPAYTDPTTGRVMDVMENDIVVKDIVDAGFGDVADETDGGTGYSSFAGEAEKKMMIAAREANGGRPGIYEQRLEATYKQEVISRAVQRLEEDAAAQGELTEREAVQQAIQEINQERRRESGGDLSVVSPKDRMISYSQKTREEMRISVEENGQLVITEDMVQPGTLRRWKSDNKGVDFNELSENKKRDIVLRGIQRLEKINPENGQTERFTEEEAVEIFDELKKQAEEGAAPGRSGQSGGGTQGFTLRTPSVFVGQKERQRRYKQEQQQMKLPVDDEEAPVPPLMRRTLETLEKVTPWLQDKLTVPAEQQKGDPPLLKDLKRWYNNSGNGGSTPTAYLGAFLSLISGAAPASAGELENASPDSLAAMTTSWQQGTRGLETAPLPQVAAATPTRYVPSAISTDKHETFVMIGVAEGTRTAGGGYTKAYYGHRDPGDGNYNRGTVSGGRNNNLSPKQVDQKWMRILTSRSQQATPVLRAAGLQPGTAGWNRVMFNVLDLSVQAPAAVGSFLSKLGQVRRQRFTVEAIAKARADSFFSPNSGRLDAPGFGNSYQRLFKDQRSRAGVFDYRRRL